LERQDRVLQFIRAQFTGDAKSAEIGFPDELENNTLATRPTGRVRRSARTIWFLFGALRFLWASEGESSRDTANPAWIQEIAVA
jgi:hypothetical protein